LESDMRVEKIETYLHADKFRSPLKFGNVVMDSLTSMIARVAVVNRAGTRGQGWGAMPLAAKWAYPDPRVDEEEKLELMVQIGDLCSRIIEERWRDRYGHPLDMMLATKETILSRSRKLSEDAGLSEVPDLLILVSTSPIDAALHDAFGRVNHISSYNAYGPRYMERDLGTWLGPPFRGTYPSEFLSRPKKKIPIFHLVGALDKLRRDEVTGSEPRDGLPACLEDWIRRDGVYCFKVKLRGTDLDWDVERTRDVAEVASEVLREKGREEFYLSVDANEMNRSTRDTLAYLRSLKKESPMAFERLLYLEQPTSRDLAGRGEPMDEVSSVRPVLADEAVTDLKSLELALRLGWSGIALKTCKWHSSCLLYLAIAGKRRLPYSIQDLTCPGISLVHSAGFGARTSPLGFEYNARQYIPFAYSEVQKRHRSVFEVKDGAIGTQDLFEEGLGYDAEVVEKTFGG